MAGVVVSASTGSENVILTGADVGTPMSPTIAGTLPFATGYASSVSVVGNLALIADEAAGLVIADVTDPANPKYLNHIPGQEGKYEGGGAQMVRVCDGKQLPKGDPNAVYMLRAIGSAGHEVWNVADPAKPVLLSRIG